MPDSARSSDVTAPEKSLASADASCFAMRSPAPCFGHFSMPHHGEGIENRIVVKAQLSLEHLEHRERELEQQHQEASANRFLFSLRISTDHRVEHRQVLID